MKVERRTEDGARSGGCNSVVPNSEAQNDVEQRQVVDGSL